MRVQVPVPYGPVVISVPGACNYMSLHRPPACSWSAQCSDRRWPRMSPCASAITQSLLRLSGIFARPAVPHRFAKPARATISCSVSAAEIATSLKWSGCVCWCSQRAKLDRVSVRTPGDAAIAHQLQRAVLAYPVDMYFSPTPNSARWVIRFRPNMRYMPHGTKGGAYR